MEYLAFEKPIEELIIKLDQAKELGKDESVDVSKTVKDIETQIKEESTKFNIPKVPKIIAIAKTFPLAAIMPLIEHGHLHFGENKVQELVGKHENLPKDIEWHMIGHLQSNKVKYIAPFVSLIHGTDSEKLLQEINKRAKQNSRMINCLLQVHIAEESTKFGFSSSEINESQKFGFKPVSLGNNRLRTETAGLAACHILNLVNEK